MSIKIVVNGALGKMGREVTGAVHREPDLELAGATDARMSQDTLPVPDSSDTVPASASLDRLLVGIKPDVVVDFTNAQGAMAAVRIAARHRTRFVTGSTGLSPENVKEIGELADSGKIGIIVAPNFTIGAILLTHLAKIAARYFDSAEIVELHHNQKLDAPSGTALSIAKAMAAGRGKAFDFPDTRRQPTRGDQVEGISLHSVRLPGLLAHHEVIFGAPGQTLTLRHDTINRECYMPGIMLAIREVVKRQGLVYGLDSLLNL